MKKQIVLSATIISTFFLCRNALSLLQKLGISFELQEERITVSWALCLIIVLVVSGILYGYKNIFSSLGLDKRILKGISYGFAFSSPMILGYAVIGELRWEYVSWLSISAIFFWAGMEEVLFRGFLFGQLFKKANWRFAPAAFLNAVIFGMGHLYQGNSFEHTLGVFAITLMGGAWFAWLYIEWDSNLWVAISLHFFMNLSWQLFSVGDTALGGWGANFFRVMTIVLSVVVTIIYQKSKKDTETIKERKDTILTKRKQPITLSNIQLGNNLNQH